MSSELLVGLMSIAGIIIGALPTYLFMRKRNLAEIEKLKAETEKTKVETTKIRAELQSGKHDLLSHPEFPREYSLSYSARREALTQTQGFILKYFSNKSFAGQYISQDTLETQFSQFRASELFYRLEHLRLLGFLDSQKTGQNQDGADRFSYRLSEGYRKEIGNPGVFVSISAST